MPRFESLELLDVEGLSRLQIVRQKWYAKERKMMEEDALEGLRVL